MMTSGRGPIETKRKSVFLFFWFGADPIDGYWSMVTNSQNVYHSCLVASLFPRARHIFGHHRRLAVHLWCGVISSFRIYSITHVAYFELPGKKCSSTGVRSTYIARTMFTVISCENACESHRRRHKNPNLVSTELNGDGSRFVWESDDWLNLYCPRRVTLCALRQLFFVFIE